MTGPYVTPEAILAAIEFVVDDAGFLAYDDVELGVYEIPRDALPYRVATQLGMTWQRGERPRWAASDLHWMLDNAPGWFTTEAQDMWEAMTDMAALGASWADIYMTLKRHFDASKLPIPF